MQLIIANYTVSLANRDVAPTTGIPGWATSGNPATGVPFTQFPAWHYNMLTAEIAYVVTSAGLQLDQTNWGQLWAAINVPVAAETARAEAVEATLVPKTDLATMQLMTQSGSLTMPAWATRVELRVIGGGGGGATSSAADTSGSFSGSGGGAGGDAWGVYTVVPPGETMQVTIGQGGGSQQAGGTSYVSYNGTIFISANGGGSGYFYATQGSAGAAGGTAAGGTIWSQQGMSGGDGQSSTATFSGYGGSGPWGGGGRAGSLGGMPGTQFGSGGGGAYGQKASGDTSPGGSGYQGCVLYRFLP